jgi:hypothetical protein
MSSEHISFKFKADGNAREVFDIFTVTIRAGVPLADPFRAVKVTSEWTCEGRTWHVDGFCDAQDGSVYRVRFMPTQSGNHHGIIRIECDGKTQAWETGVMVFETVRNKGVLRVSPQYPHHFEWSGTGEPFFWNATTAYLMAGLSEPDMRAALDRLASYGINRVRVSLCPSRQKNGGRWFETQVGTDETFTFCYSPWLCRQPDNVTDPQPDTTRFDVAYWQKFERLLAHAQKRGIIVQVVFFTDAQEPQNYPFDRERLGDDPDERRYYAYALARLGAFANVEYCLTNEWKLFRPDEWAEAIGAFLEGKDVYGHPTSIHGHPVFPFRTSPWADFALYQQWDEHGAYDFMLKQRQEQDATGQPKPQINEEYGYEDHYPGQWGEGRVAPARNADSRRRLAWEIVMAGCYQTTGESAQNGLGGWINGRGDNSMTMLLGYKHLKEFFEGFEWRRLEPRPDLAPAGTRCLAEPGVRYVLYLPQGSETASLSDFDLEGGEANYRIRWFNPRSGAFEPKPDTSGDWVSLIEK